MMKRFGQVSRGDGSANTLQGGAELSVEVGTNEPLRLQRHDPPGRLSARRSRWWRDQAVAFEGCRETGHEGSMLRQDRGQARQSGAENRRLEGRHAVVQTPLHDAAVWTGALPAFIGEERAALG